MSARASIAACLLLLAVAGAPWASADGDEAERQAKAAIRQKHFDEHVQPFLTRFCYDCHSAGDDSPLKLDQLTKASEISTTGYKQWKKVYTKLYGRAMPPEDVDQPDLEERDKVAAWLKATLDDYDCSGPTDPGRTTLRRLTRFEYKNTVRDLIGVEVKLADDFPLDDVGYGFDNIGDVLTLSPLLFEKYLAAAEEIARAAIVADPLQAMARRRIEASDMQREGVNDAGDGWRLFTSSGSLRGRFEVPAEGEYLVRVHAYGDQAGDELPKMRVVVADDRREIDVPAMRDEPADYEFKLRLPRGEQRVSVEFINDYYAPNNPDPERRDRNLAVKRVDVVGPIGGEGIYPDSHKRIMFVTPSDQLSEAEAAKQILQRLASRAFRRPASDVEVARLMKLAERGREQSGTLAGGVQLALQAVLTSPHFLFKVEGEPLPNDADHIYDLNEYELATRLSYFLWGTMPDDELFAVATRGELRAELEPQVRRMLADPKSQALVDNFMVQWLQLRRLASIEPDRRRFPRWSDNLRADMLTETKLFVGAIVHEDRSVLELIDADYTFLNKRLADFYGVAGVDGDEFKRIGVGAVGRGGLLTQASVLTLTSNPTRTSPVKRGKWIMENLLGTPPPDPPANVPELENSREARSSATLRERLEEHRKNADCAVCHVQMDALGLAFENYDAVGAFREREGRFEIDASGKLPSGAEFNGAAELKRLLLAEAKDDFLRCLAEKTLTYAVGRGVEYFDRCTIDGIAAGLARDDYKFSRLVLSVVESDAFQKRKGK